MMTRNGGGIGVSAGGIGVPTRSSGRWCRGGRRGQHLAGLRRPALSIRSRCRAGGGPRGGSCPHSAWSGVAGTLPPRPRQGSEGAPAAGSGARAPGLSRSRCDRRPSDRPPGPWVDRPRGPPARQMSRRSPPACARAPGDHALYSVHPPIGLPVPSLHRHAGSGTAPRAGRTPTTRHHRGSDRPMDCRDCSPSLPVVSLTSQGCEAHETPDRGATRGPAASGDIQQ